MLASLVLAAGCSRLAPRSTVHTLVLPELPAPELPDAPGRPMVIGACSTCHSLRYIVDQPPLPRAAWAAVVSKMRHSFGAPFPEEMASPIVDYLALSLAPAGR